MGWLKKKRLLPCALIVKKPICSLLKLLGNRFWLLVALEPSLVLFMETPALILECLRREVLLIRPLFVVEDVEKCIRIYTRV